MCVCQRKFVKEIGGGSRGTHGYSPFDEPLGDDLPGQRRRYARSLAGGEKSESEDDTGGYEVV
jgi:hypothetical protein